MQEHLLVRVHEKLLHNRKGVRSVLWQDDRTLMALEKIYSGLILKAESGFHLSYFDNVSGIQLALANHFLAVDLHLGLAL